MGYTPEPLSISYTLEYAYADWCVAQLAKALGKEEDAKRFYEKGKPIVTCLMRKRLVPSPECRWIMESMAGECTDRRMVWLH